MGGASIRLPDPNCDTQFLTLRNPASSWTIASKPSGAAGTLTAVSPSQAQLVADKGGPWVITYTACPSTCQLGGVSVGPLSKSVTLNPILVTEGHFNVTELRTALIQLLKDSRIQVSHTNNGIPVPGSPASYQVHWSVPSYKYSQLCVEPLNAPPNWQPAPICAHWENGGLSGDHTFRTYTPIYNSYVDFGPNAVAAGAPDVIPLPVSTVERDVPTALRVAIMGAQPGSILYGMDVDKIQILINNIFLDLNDTTKWNVRVEDGGITLAVKLSSSHPTIKCQAHWNGKTLYVLSVSSGWSDELCPDFDMSQMDLTVHLNLSAANDKVAVTDAQVSVQLTPSGTQSGVIDFIGGVTDTAETQIASALRSKLLEPTTKLKLGDLLTQGVRTRFPEMCTVVTLSVPAFGDLLVRYTKPFNPVMACPPTTVYH
jgi:hypothetical protein